MASTTPLEVAQAYEEVVFRRFGASAYIPHDQNPRFIGEVFREFRAMMESRQPATLAYRPQANGQQVQPVQTVVRSIQSFVERPDQGDWDDIVERRIDTMPAMLSQVPRGEIQRDAYLWRTKTWRAMSDKIKSGFSVGDSVWLCMARVKPGLPRKLAHLWRGPFRMLEAGYDFRCKLKVAGTSYKFLPWDEMLTPAAGLSSQNVQRTDDNRPSSQVHTHIPSEPGDQAAPQPSHYLAPDHDDDLELDAALLPEDSRALDEDAGEFEVEQVLDNRLSCGALLYEFGAGIRAKARFATMQSGDDHPGE
ncbi:hypothetical protein PybrP1_006422 [[Pythium] brassicae (nom. inval.)]|nr:hypothetical protein PybrP1_006422 [[Pythium] brassicae (nom. inval.)]